MTEQEAKKVIESLENALGKSKPEDISYLWIAGIGQIVPPTHTMTMVEAQRALEKIEKLATKKAEQKE